MKFKVLAALATLTLPTVAFAAPKTFQELAYFIVTLLDTASGILIVAGLVVYFFGISTNLFKAGQESSQQLKTQLLWGLLVLFIMVSIWGILQILQETLFLSNSGAATGGNSSVQPSQFSPPAFNQ